jgi:bifunctional DNA-binding transcriptional regulator/antitoxin component of YhaV-PrlF toxin-antitoxin module
MKKQHLKVIREIQETIPADLLKNLTIKEKQFSTLKEVCEKGLLEPDDVVPPRQKRKLQAMLDSGYLEKEVEVINKPVEAQIDEYITKEIDRAVADGRLPRKVDEMEFKSKVNKGKQYARRQQKRLAALHNKPMDEVASVQESNTKE